MNEFEKWLQEQDDQTQELIEKRFHKLEEALKKERRLRKLAEKGLEKLAGKELMKSLREAATIGVWIESRIHLLFSEIADNMYGDGYLTRDERVILSGGISEALSAFTAHIEKEAPQLYERPPWDYPDSLAEGQTRLEGDFIPLLERAVQGEGSATVKVIEPGWGSSGYYPVEVLERDGPEVFTAGLQMFWDHPTATEEVDRPERSLRDLAGVFESDARWDENGPDGPGLYADISVFDEYQNSVNELAEHIGVSIRALGRANQGEAEGKTGLIIDELVAAKSVDFVTVPGAGGKVLDLFEAARGRNDGARPKKADEGRDDNKNDDKESASMDVKELQEANAQLQAELDAEKEKAARLQEAAVMRHAKEAASAQLAESELPAISHKRLVESLAKDPPVTDEGELDEKQFAEQIEEAVKAETAYLAELTGSGTINDLGDSVSVDEKADKDILQEADASLQDAFADLGLNESTAKIAAQGRK